MVETKCQHKSETLILKNEVFNITKPQIQTGIDRSQLGQRRINVVHPYDVMPLVLVISENTPGAAPRFQNSTLLRIYRQLCIF